MSARPAAKRAPRRPLRPFVERNGKLMTVEEAAEYLGVVPRMVKRLLDDRKLPKTKIGKLVRIHVEDLDEYVAKQRGEGGK